MFVFMLISYISVSWSKDEACNPLCNESMLGNGKCDYYCMNQACNFDSSTFSDNIYFILENSDCIYYCSCYFLGLLANGECDAECDSYLCGFDAGDCGYCTSGCFITDLFSDTCKEECKDDRCKIESTVCADYCAPGCLIEDLEYNCKKECLVKDCLEYQPNYCESDYKCAPQCSGLKLMNEECDPECNNTDCFYDFGYCYCSPGCNDTSGDCLTDGKGFLDPCDTEACNFKDGKCRYCAPGCNKNYLGDGICQADCNVESCNYDYGDCGCAPGCNFKYNPEESKFVNGDFYVEDCNSHCLVVGCNFGIDFCPYEVLVKAAIYSFIKHKNTLSIYKFDTCFEYGCSLQEISNLMEGSSQCDEFSKCRIDSCSNCFTLPSINIKECGNTRQINDQCNLCLNSARIAGYCYDSLDSCPYGYEELDKISNLYTLGLLCLRDPEHYSTNNYKEVYVYSTAVGKENEEGITIYKTLYNALVEVYAAFTKIYLKDQEVDLIVDDSWTSTIVTDKLDPLNIKTVYESYELWIIGNYSQDKYTVVYWKDNIKITPLAHKFYVKNIEFIGKYVMNKNCNSEFCFYCPYYTGIGDADKYDDKSELIDSNIFSNYYSKTCSSYSTVDVFNFANEAYLEDVIFSEFRYQYNSLIRSSGILDLKNVDFYKLQSKSRASIILVECNIEDCIDTSFKYDKGIVSDIGAGYNDGFNVTTGSFFRCFNTGYISITSVNFTFNFAYSNPRSPDTGYLIYVKNFQGTMAIKDCYFYRNYVNHLIYIDVRSLIYPNYRLKNGISEIYSQKHFLLENVYTNDTYCSKSMIYYIMNNVVHNIDIINLFIKSSVVGNQGVISLINTGILEESDINGIFYIEGENKIEIKPRNMNLENIFLASTKTGKHSIYIENYPNIKLKKINVSNVADGTIYDIKSIINLFSINDVTRYISFIHISNIPDLYCNDMVIISDSINLLIESLWIEEIFCNNEESLSGLSLSNIIGDTTISNIRFTNIKAGINAGIAITVIDSNSVEIDVLTIVKVINTKESILKFEKCYNIIIHDVLIDTVSSNYSPAFAISDVMYFTIKYFDFNDMSTDYSNGGCLYFLSGISGSYIEITSGNFTRCKTIFGKGGGFFLDSISRLGDVSLKVNNVKMSNCSSDEGSSIFISNNVAFMENEKQNGFLNLFIENSVSKSGGTISDYHYSGYLKFDNLKMLNNSHGIYVFYSNEYPELQILNISIDASFNLNSAIYLSSLLYGAKVFIQNIEIYDSPKIGIEAFNIRVSIENFTIEDSFQAIYINGNVEFEAKNLKVTNIKGKSVMLSKNCTFICSDCEFNGNLYNILDVTSNSNFSLINSQIFSNVLDSGYIFYIFSEDSKESSLINCKIYANLLYTGNVIYLSSSTLTLKNCSIIENKAKSSSIQIIYSYNSKLYIYNSRFQSDINAYYGELIYATAGSVLIAENSIFQNSRSLIGNIHGSNAKIEISNCTFKNNTGSDLYVEISNFKIINSNFGNSLLTDLNSGVIKLKNNLKVSIFGTSFKNISVLPSLNSHAYVYDESSEQLEIFNCSMTLPGSNLKAVYLIETSMVTISSSKFIGFDTIDYSALTAISTREGSKLNIINSKISNNLSQKNGGGLYSQSYDLKIENTEVSFNKAQQSGGGIYFTTPDCNDCGIYLLGETIIFENSCSGDGGAIKWKDFKPYKDDSVLIYNNSAVYGADFASIPAKFGLSQGRLLSESIITTLSSVPPGKKINETIEVYIYDTYGQVMKTENSILATLSVNSTEDSIFALSGITSFKAENGILNVSNFILTGTPGSSGYLKLESNNMVNSGARNDYTEYTNSAYIKVEFRNCTNGEQIQASACIDCTVGKYTLRASQNCLNCPNGALCPGGDTIIVNNGFWRSSLESDVIYQCDVFDACLKGTQTNQLGNCSSGYSGVLCKACEVGYSKTANGICSRCPSKKTNFVAISLISFALIFISFILVKTTLTSAFSPKALHSIYIKILTNYLQLVFIVTQFDLEWPSYVVEFFNIQRSTASVSDQLFSLDCFILLKNTKDLEDVYYTKLCIITAVPIVILALSYIYWILYSFFVESYKFLKREVFTTIIVLFFLVYPTIVKFMFSNFSCIEIDKMNSYLNENTSIECWNLNHKKFSFIVVIPSIILWVVGIPTILLILMTKSKRRLHLDYYRVVYGFLYNGYKQSRFYWEISIMYRKILLITITVFKISQAHVLQALNLIIVLLGSIYLHFFYRPYNSNQLNSMEMQSLNIAAITIYFGLYYLSKSIGEAIKILLFIFIILGNSYFICYWIYYMAKALIDIFIKYFPRFKSLLKRGDAFEEDFNNEEIVRSGVFFNSLEGKDAFTLFKLENEAKDENETFNHRNMEDIYKIVAKRDVERCVKINK